MKNNVNFFIFPSDVLILDANDFSRKIKVQIAKFLGWGSVLLIKLSLSFPLLYSPLRCQSWNSTNYKSTLHLALWYVLPVGGTAGGWKEGKGGKGSRVFLFAWGSCQRHTSSDSSPSQWQLAPVSIFFNKKKCPKLDSLHCPVPQRYGQQLLTWRPRLSSGGPSSELLGSDESKLFLLFPYP